MRPNVVDMDTAEVGEGSTPWLRRNETAILNDVPLLSVYCWWWLGAVGGGACGCRCAEHAALTLAAGRR